MRTTIPAGRIQPGHSVSSSRPSGSGTSSPGPEMSLPHLHNRMNHLESSVHELRSTALTKDGYVERRNREDEHIRRELETQRAISHRLDLNVGALRSDVAQIRSDVVQINSRLDSIDSRVDSMDSRMRYSDRVRFNSLAHTILAPISPVPVIADDGSSEWPKYFPRTVWKFWCLKKKSRGTR
jgi:hypothetical protein